MISKGSKMGHFSAKNSRMEWVSALRRKKVLHSRGFLHGSHASLASEGPGPSGRVMKFQVGKISFFKKWPFLIFGGGLPYFRHFLEAFSLFEKVDFQKSTFQKWFFATVQAIGVGPGPGQARTWGTPTGSNYGHF